MRGGSKAVWNFSKNSSDLLAGSFPYDYVSTSARSKKDHKADSCGLITTLLATLEMGYMHSNNLAQEAKTLPATTITFLSFL